MMLWDYSKKELQKSKNGKILLLERMINFGPGKEKISLFKVKKYWKQLHLLPLRKRFFELILWEK